MKRDKPQNAGDIIESLKRSTSLGTHLEHARIWERWPEVADAEIMAHSRPLGIRESTLLLEVENAVWMHKVSYYKSSIIRGINRLAGREIVSEVFCCLNEDLDSDDPQDDV